MTTSYCGLAWSAGMIAMVRDYRGRWFGWQRGGGEGRVGMVYLRRAGGLDDAADHLDSTGGRADHGGRAVVVSAAECGRVVHGDGGGRSVREDSPGAGSSAGA